MHKFLKIIYNAGSYWLFPRGENLGIAKENPSALWLYINLLNPPPPTSSWICLWLATDTEVYYSIYLVQAIFYYPHVFILTGAFAKFRSMHRDKNLSRSIAYVMRSGSDNRFLFQWLPGLCNGACRWQSAERASREQRRRQGACVWRHDAALEWVAWQQARVTINLSHCHDNEELCAAFADHLPLTLTINTIHSLNPPSTSTPP